MKKPTPWGLALGAFCLMASLVGACGGDSSDPAGPSGPPGAIAVTVATTGDDLDPEGYRLALGGTLTTPEIPINGTVAVTDIDPGTYEAELVGVAVNCPIADGGRRSVTVVSGDTSRITFTVSCEPAGTIAFASNREGIGRYDIYTVKANGTEFTKLTFDPAPDSWPSWSPSGRLAFWSWQSGSPELWVLDADGLAMWPVTVGRFVNGAGEWSPDGEWLAFHENGAEMDVAVVRFDGTALTVLDPGTRSPWPYRLSWSPDGEWLAYTRRVHDEPGLTGMKVYRVRGDGSGRERLTDSPHDDFAPRWSPQGDLIAYGTHGSVAVMEPAGAGQRVLTAGILPRWSPDGQWIAFTSDRTGDIEVYVMRRDGTEERQVSQGGGDGPDWSPDGRVLVYHRRGDIFVVRRDGANLSQLTRGEPNDLRPRFRPDL